MIRSMFSAISGLRNHQTMMDVVGNNISNANTTGFKSSNTVFQDVLSQAVRGGGAAQEELGGTNPAQVGLGSRVAAITSNFGQGAMQRTGRSTDLAVEGDGFFVVDQAGQDLYTRAGSLSIDALGRLVTQEGGFVQGWGADSAGEVNTNAGVDQLEIPVGDLTSPVTTDRVSLGGNLPGDADDGTTIANSVEIYDEQGNPWTLSVQFEKTGEDAWDVAIDYVDPDTDELTGTYSTVASLAFGSDGELTSDFEEDVTAGLPASFTGDFELSFGREGGADRLTQFGDLSTVSIIDQNGSAAGSLESFTVSQEGRIVGSYSNGGTKTIGQIALASFANPEGLEKVGGSNYRATMNSGLAQIGTAGAGGRGLMSTGTLEMSNVDLAQEFTNLIVAQRGFQSNSRVVTTSDELLQEVVNLKR
ncbi:MAG: flagellar basal-body rod protein FlgF [Acidimicrobiales bacterium]